MSNRLTTGTALVGRLDTDGLVLGGTTVTSTAAELNITDGLTATATELNAAADLSVNGGLVRTKKISISTAPTGAEQDTGWDLPANSIVIDVFLDVTTAEVTGGTKTMDVGLLSSESGGDTDGFLRGVSVATTGVRRGGFVSTTGSNNTYIGAASTHTRGVLLMAAFITGEDIAAGGDGVASVGTYAIATAKSVVYDAGSNDWVEFRGAIYIVYLEFG